MTITTRALAFASRWFDAATVQRVFEPLIADWQREWHDAHPSRRWWVSIRALTAFACAVVVSSPRIVMTPIPRSIAFAMAKRIAIFCAIVAIVLGLPLTRALHGRLLDATWTETWLLRILPSTVMTAFPFSMVLAIDAIRRDRSASPQVMRAAALKLALVALLFASTAESVVVPFANATWRRVSTPAGWNLPLPQPQESSTLVLLRHPDRFGPIVSDNYTRAGDIRVALVSRSVASVLPVLLIWLRWTMLARSRRGRYWPASGGPMTAVIVVAFSAAYVTGFYAERLLRWQAGNGMWLPVVVFGAWALLEQRRAADPQEA